MVYVAGLAVVMWKLSQATLSPIEILKKWQALLIHSWMNRQMLDRMECIGLRWRALAMLNLVLAIKRKNLFMKCKLQVSAANVIFQYFRCKFGGETLLLKMLIAWKSYIYVVACPGFIKDIYIYLYIKVGFLAHFNATNSMQ